LFYIVAMAMEYQALLLVEQVVHDLATRDYNIKSALRNCQHACELLGWQSEQQWFDQELNGYGNEMPLPSYRVAYGQLVWRQGASGVEWPGEEMWFGPALDIQSGDAVVMEVRAGIDWLLEASRQGYSVATGETMDVWSRSQPQMINLQRFRVFPAEQFAALLSVIQQRAFNFAYRAQVQLRALEATELPAGASSPAQAMRHEQIKLFDILSGDRVTLSDLRDICFRLHLDWEVLNGESKTDKARELVLYFHRRNALAELRDAIARTRPDLKSELEV
jgi:hypothetical protein